MQSDANPDTSEEVQINRFLDLVAEMFGRSDYLLPLAAGQRQFRQDNYQMASAAQLEDLFFDAFGMYLRENHPSYSLQRRLGAELWDYAFDGLELSHKESLSRTISVWWTAGDKVDGRYVPHADKQIYTSPHPVVLVYSGTEAVPWTTELANSAAERNGTLVGALGPLAIAGRRLRSLDHTLVLGEQVRADRLDVERVWAPGEWSSANFMELWPTLGGDGLCSRDLWVDKKPSAKGSTGLGSVAHLASGCTLELTKPHIQPGIYVIPTDLLTDVPMVANNRAHSLDPAFVDRALSSSRTRGHFRPFPTWFAHFAEAAPPNLYVQQRAQYEQIFAARQRML